MNRLLTKICPFVVVQSFRMLMDNVGCHFVEKSSVVRDDEHGAWVCLKIIGQEGD